MVSVSLFALRQGFNLSFNPNVFGDPLVFRPERWMDKGLIKDPYQFVPFSAGSRNCIGQHLAMIEIKVMICYFL